MVSLGCLILIFLFGSLLANSMYKDLDIKLNGVKNQLEEILEFEKEQKFTSSNKKPLSAQYIWQYKCVERFR